MKEFFCELLELLAGCVLIVCLSLASFLFIANLYHHKEVRSLEVFDESSKAQYNDYKQLLSKVDKKMKSVNYNDVAYSTTAKPIYDYYNTCIESIKNGTFAQLENKDSISAKDIYDSNNEILTEYNNKCIFYIPYNITVINKVSKPNVSFNSIYKITETKRKIVIDNADYLIKSGLGNSSYRFVTDTSKNSIYNKTTNEFRLTINNYKMIASILDDVANWYVSEYGGNS